MALKQAPSFLYVRSQGGGVMILLLHKKWDVRSEISFVRRGVDNLAMGDQQHEGLDLVYSFSLLAVSKLYTIQA